ncbi:hypothetical protein B0H15DRAFT_958830 [Mycena belliarum]|uniref:Uncharacterized protein n=1 Tax=Mycena belliarum TaxID=1033014 RepID=A0AAD6TPL5_9AGAR|nr:hypothetical protein B0H15DRAFT_958830 [Mycena belliae]
MSVPDINQNPADTSMATGAFLSAISQENPVPSGSSPANPPRSPIRTARVKVRRDENGVHYLVDPKTGTRYDVSDDESIPLDGPPQASGHPSKSGTPTAGTVSDTSDIADTVEAGFTSEGLLAALVTDLRTEALTDPQIARFNTLRGILSMTRTSLLSTTGLVAGQRANFLDVSEALREFRDEAAERFDPLNDEIGQATNRLESTLDNNIRVLRAIGATESQLASVAEAVQKGRDDPRRPAILLPLINRSDAAHIALGDLQASVDHALPPQGAQESHKEFTRHGNATVDRRMRTTESFTTTGLHPAEGAPIASTEPTEHRVAENLPAAPVRQARFVDNSSISTAGRPPQFMDNSSISTAGIRRSALSAGPIRGPMSTISPMGTNQSPSGYLLANNTPHETAFHCMFEVFAAEKGDQIRRIVDRHLGNAMEAPPRAPKLNNPPCYRGEDDDDKFISWLGKTCTWLQGYGLGGPKYEAHRIVYLKTALDSHAIEWFDQEVEEPGSDIQYEFVKILCAMHHRFITSATAQRATKEFEAVRFDAAQGVEHLVGELIRTARKMREPPTEFTIRQRFMRLIPAKVHDELIRRGLMPEYASLEILKNHARAWIEAQGHLRSGGGETGSSAFCSTHIISDETAARSDERQDGSAEDRRPDSSGCGQADFSSKSASGYCRGRPGVPHTWSVACWQLELQPHLLWMRRPGSHSE